MALRRRQTDLRIDWLQSGVEGALYLRVQSCRPAGQKHERRLPGSGRRQVQDGCRAAVARITPTQFLRTLRRYSLSYVAPCGAVPLDCARPPGRAPAGHHATVNSLVAAPLLCITPVQILRRRRRFWRARVRRTKDHSPARQRWDWVKDTGSPGTGRKDRGPSASFAPFRGWLVGDLDPGLYALG